MTKDINIPKIQTYFFSQDNDCHWYMIPTELREDFRKWQEMDEESDEFYELLDTFSDYMTGGGISDIEFIPIT